MSSSRLVGANFFSFSDIYEAIELHTREANEEKNIKQIKISCFGKEIFSSRKH